MTEKNDETNKPNRDKEPEKRGVWIPPEILVKDDLTAGEKILLCKIASLCQKHDYCFASNQYLGNQIGKSKGVTRKLIASLDNKDYLDVDYNDVGQSYKRKREIRLSDKIEMTFRNKQGEIEGVEDFSGGRKNIPHEGNNLPGGRKNPPGGRNNSPGTKDITNDKQTELENLQNNKHGDGVVVREEFKGKLGEMLEDIYQVKGANQKQIATELLKHDLPALKSQLKRKLKSLKWELNNNDHIQNKGAYASTILQQITNLKDEDYTPPAEFEEQEIEDDQAGNNYDYADFDFGGDNKDKPAIDEIIELIEECQEQIEVDNDE